MGCASSKAVWHAYGGVEFESALRPDRKLGDSPVKLVDARYLVKLITRWA